MLLGDKVRGLLERIYGSVIEGVGESGGCVAIGSEGEF